MLPQLLDRLISFAARDEEETVRANREWVELAGHVFEDDPLFEEHTSAFLEWYTLDRRGKDERVPAQRLLEREQLEPLERQWIDALLRSHRSLFAVHRLEAGKVVVDDLLAGGQFAVSPGRPLPGLEVDDIFEARLVANVEAPPEVTFARALQFHPREARAELRRQADAVRRGGHARAEALFRFLRLRLKSRHYQHVPAAQIYRDE